MGDPFDIEIAEPEKLFLLWNLLYPCENDLLIHEWGNAYQELDLDDQFSGVILESDIHGYLAELVAQKVIRDMYITALIYSKDSTIKEPIDVKKYYFGLTRPKKMPPKVSFVIDPSEVESEDEQRLFYAFRLNRGHATKYIEMYLGKWQANDLYFPKTNFLKKEIQLGYLIEDIFHIVKEHSHKNMLYELENKVETDVVACLLFLEAIGDIEIKEWVRNYRDPSYESSLHHVTLRLTLTDKFFQDFTQSKGSVLFDFKELVASKGKPTKTISFDAPYRLYCGEEEYRLKRDKLPYMIINRGFQDNLITTVDLAKLLKDASVTLEEAKKAIENFRRALREKFDFPESETFFDIVDDEVLLKSRLFRLQG